MRILALLVNAMRMVSSELPYDSDPIWSSGSRPFIVGGLTRNSIAGADLQFGFGTALGLRLPCGRQTFILGYDPWLRGLFLAGNLQGFLINAHFGPLMGLKARTGRYIEKNLARSQLNLKQIAPMRQISPADLVLTARRFEQVLRVCPASAEFPSRPGYAAEVFLGFGSVWEFHVLCVPFQLFTGAISDVAQVISLGQRSGVCEMT